MSEIIEKLTEAVGRRRFLGKVASAAAAVVLTVVGIDSARASGGLIEVECCSLCKDPTTCTYGNCACQWKWPCGSGGGAGCFLCWECYFQTGPHCTSDDGCEFAKCSRVTPRACQ